MTDRHAAMSPDHYRALETLELLSNKWSPVVVLALQQHGSQGFNDLLESIPGVSSKVLSDTLETLQDAGLVERRVVSESPLRVEYDRTDAGRDIEPVFEALSEWGRAHLDIVTQTVLLADSDRRITEMYHQWLTDRYTVRRAHDAETLHSQFDEHVDVVMLDIGLPGTDPHEFGAGFEHSHRTVLIVGDRPDLDLLTVDCDDILRKPFVRETALETIGEQCSRLGEPPTERERASLQARRSLFDSLYSRDRLDSHPAYQEVADRLAQLDGVDSE